MTDLKRIVLLLLLIVFSLFVNAQKTSTINMVEIANKWDSILSDIDSSNFETSHLYITNKELQNSVKKIRNDIRKAKTDFESGFENEALYNHLFRINTNTSLWYSQVTSDDFQIFLRRMVTGRPINKDVIQNLKKSYVKWLKAPSLRNLDRYSQLLHDAGRSYEILTKLSVITNETDGIVVKYRSITEETVEILDGTSIIKMIPVGNYYVWLEKEGSIVSDNTSGYPCITSTKQIVLKTMQGK